MRTHKYRAWNVAEKKMHYTKGNCGDIDQVYLSIKEDGWSMMFDNSEDDLKCLACSGNGDILMQYIEINDENGIKMYEMDILRLYEYRDDDNHENSVFTDHIVKWFGEDDYPAFDLEPNLDCDCNGLSGLMNSTGYVSYEVIGNTCKDSDLLKEKEDI